MKFLVFASKENYVFPISVAVKVSHYVSHHAQTCLEVWKLLNNNMFVCIIVHTFYPWKWSLMLFCCIIKGSRLEDAGYGVCLRMLELLSHREKVIYVSLFNLVLRITEITCRLKRGNKIIGNPLFCTQHSLEIPFWKGIYLRLGDFHLSFEGCII